jgi:hypothetical protein
MIGRGYGAVSATRKMFQKVNLDLSTNSRKGIGVICYQKKMNPRRSSTSRPVLYTSMECGTSSGTSGMRLPRRLPSLRA